MRHYADLPIVFLSHFAWWQYALLAAGAAAGVGGAGLGTRLPALGHRVRTMAPTLLAFAVVGAAVYALLLREPVHGLLAPRDAYSLRTFASFYLTVPGLLAALLGFALLARRDLLAGAGALHHGGALLVLLLLQDPHCLRSFLDGAAVSSGHPARRAAVCRGRCLERHAWWLGPDQMLRTTIGLAFVMLLATQFTRAAKAYPAARRVRRSHCEARSPVEHAGRP